jgi:hypothetical protein
MGRISIQAKWLSVLSYSRLQAKATFLFLDASAHDVSAQFMRPALEIPIDWAEQRKLFGSR